MAKAPQGTRSWRRPWMKRSATACSPAKEKTKPSTPASARAPLRVPLPFYDYVCDANLTTEREARDHFETETHRNRVGAFLVRHRDQLESKDPEALAQLNSTLTACLSEHIRN